MAETKTSVLSLIHQGKHFRELNWEELYFKEVWRSFNRIPR